jgi:hypothetical protein
MEEMGLANQKFLQQRHAQLFKKPVKDSECEHRMSRFSSTDSIKAEPNVWRVMAAA